MPNLNKNLAAFIPSRNIRNNDSQAHVIVICALTGYADCGHVQGAFLPTGFLFFSLAGRERGKDKESEVNKTVA